MPAVDGLTDKQERFCLEYLVDLNATQAAIRAGYSRDTASKIGSENLSKPDVAARIAELQAERSRETKIDAAWLLKRLAEEATADVADIWADDGTLLPISEWPMIWRIGLVQGIEVDEIYEGAGDSRKFVGYTKKIKVSDRIKRLELIGKHVGVQAFKDQVEHSGGVNITITPTDADL